MNLQASFNYSYALLHHKLTHQLNFFFVSKYTNLIKYRHKNVLNSPKSRKKLQCKTRSYQTDHTHCCL